LYSFIEEILTIILNLLNDSLAKTRIHSTGKQLILFNQQQQKQKINYLNSFEIKPAAIGNLVNHKLSDKMISLKVPQKLLEVACHDTQFSVQESALNVLRLFCKHEKAKKVSNCLNKEYVQYSSFKIIYIILIYLLLF